MKFHRLSEAQFHEMHEEFSVFLVSNGIDKKKWGRIKDEFPQKVTFLLDKFSDLVWKKILNQCNYLEFSTHHIYLFSFEKSQMRFIAIYTEHVDFTTNDGFSWLRDNLLDDNVNGGGGSNG